MTWPPVINTPPFKTCLYPIPICFQHTSHLFSAHRFPSCSPNLCRSSQTFTLYNSSNNDLADAYRLCTSPTLLPCPGLVTNSHHCADHACCSSILFYLISQQNSGTRACNMPGHDRAAQLPHCDSCDQPTWFCVPVCFALCDYFWGRNPIPTLIHEALSPPTNV